MKKIESVTLPAGLYLVATPIGNLRDITLRALDVLSAVDLVVCEDTRITGKLLQAYGLKKDMWSYNDHSNEKQRAQIREALSNGKRIALTSDAGMPLVSDPGYKLVRDCLDLDIAVTTIPGANAPLSALQLSGLPSDRFVFLGFLPSKTEARRTYIREQLSRTETMIFFETAPRLAASLTDMAEVLREERPAAVVREITKKFEQVLTGSLGYLVKTIADNPVKGEIVVVIGGAEGTGMQSDEAVADQLRTALQTMSVKDAAAFVAQASGRRKKDVYSMALEIANESDSG